MASMPCRNLVEVARDRDLADRASELAVLDQEAFGAPRERARDGVEAEAHHAGDVQPGLDAVQQRARLDVSRPQVEVADRAVRDAATARGRAVGVWPSLRAL